MNKWSAIALASLSFTVAANDAAPDCGNPSNTIEINQCASLELELAKAELTTYLETSLEHNAFDPELVESIKAAQKTWQAYLLSHCNAVYTQWREGTIRDLMAMSCQTKLTRQRTHEIWSSFLTYMDNTPPVLPEPKW